jgi:flagellar biosynthesis/type III secretory pathway protein FliH
MSMGIDKKTKVINDAVAAISQLYGGTAGLGQAKEEALREKYEQAYKQEYEQAYEQAYKEAYAEGVEIGSRKVKIKAAIYLLTKDYSIEDISEMTKLDVDTVKELAVKK